MRLVAMAFVVLAALTAPVWAQPLPPSLRSAGITETQWSQAQGVIRSQATTLNLREDAVRTLAIEIFAGQPGLSFDACLQLIRDGAQRLPQLVATARALDPGGDAMLADLQRRAVAAAQAGRLREALALQDEYRTAFQIAWERAAEQPRLQLAAAHAAAGETAFALADYVGASTRFEMAADTLPASATAELWEYRFGQADALYQRGLIFSEPEALAEAARLYRDVVLPLSSRETRPFRWARINAALAWVYVKQGERGVAGAFEDATASFEDALTVMTRAAHAEAWADAQMGLGLVYQRQGEWGAQGALERAVSAYEQALEVRTQEADPYAWAVVNSNLGGALRILGERGAPGMLTRAIAAYNSTLTVWTRESYPTNWATIQFNLASAYIRQGEQGVPSAFDDAVTAFELALTVRTRETNPVGWATTQSGLGTALSSLGRRGSPGAYERAISAYQAALTVRTRHANPAGWADTTYSMAVAYAGMGRFGEARAAAGEAIAVYEQIGNTYWAARARAFLAGLPDA